MKEQLNLNFNFLIILHLIFQFTFFIFHSYRDFIHTHIYINTVGFVNMPFFRRKSAFKYINRKISDKMLSFRVKINKRGFRFAVKYELLSEGSVHRRIFFGVGRKKMYRTEKFQPLVSCVCGTGFSLVPVLKALNSKPRGFYINSQNLRLRMFSLFSLDYSSFFFFTSAYASLH